ncbi:MAG: hypothetical protein JSU85_13970 [Candidatus Zixiibacteriota bacterium]|nr:MAG: hypothetical protein JSU85_13970 [candidate division Zixibacteria bacterium]
MAYKTIKVMGDPVVKEYVAAGAITPGHLVELDTNGKIQAHSTAGGSAQKRFALEDENQGKEIGDAYSTGNIVKTGVFKPGDEVYALLADGETATKHSLLESYGDGTLRVVDTDASAGEIAVHSIVGEALEALDMSGSSGEDPSSNRILIEIW